MPINREQAIEELRKRLPSMTPEQQQAVNEILRKSAAPGAPESASVAELQTAANKLGTTDDALITQFGFNPEEIKKSPRYQDNLKRYGSGLAFLLTDPKRNDIAAKLADSPLGDLGMGAMDILTGVHQLGIHGLNKVGLVSDEDAKYVDLVNRLTEEDYKQNVRHGNSNWFTRLLGNVAVPMPAGKASGVMSAIRQGAVGAAVQPVLTGDPNSYWAEKGTQTALGAAAGPIFYGAATVAGKGAAKVINAVQGTGMSPEAAAVMQAGEKHGVPLTFGDISRNPMAQKLEQRLEDVPGTGMSKLRKTQHDAARTAVDKTATDLKQTFESIHPADIADVQKAALEGDDYARKVLEQVINAGKDPDRVMQASIGLQNFRTRMESDKLYGRVEALVSEHLSSADEFGNKVEAQVPVQGIGEVLRWALADAERSKIPDKEMVGLLKTIREKMASDNTFGTLRRLRSDVADMIRDKRTNKNAIIGPKGVGYLERLRGAIEGDLQLFVDESGVPAIQKAAREADVHYKDVRVPFKDRQLTYAAESNEPDQIFQLFVREGKGDRAQKLFNAADEQAQAGVRWEMVRRGIEEATDRAKQIFSPTKFFGYLDKYSDAADVFFKGETKFELDGLKRLMSHVARAGQFAENPPTGNRLVGAATTFGVPAIAGAGLAIHPQATMAGLGAYGLVVGASRFLLTTNAGKKFLLSASMLPPGSPAMQRLLDQIVAAAPAAGGKAAGLEGR